MILFYTENSPYARTARIALREWGVLGNAEERLAANREADNPVLEFSPVGRVPTLIDAGLVITEARSVFAYVCDFADAKASDSAALPDWTAVAEEGQIAGFLDGIASWVREDRRAPDKRSDFLLSVERDRMLRCLDFLNRHAAVRPLPAVSKFRGAALASALHLMDRHRFCPDWKAEYKELAAWFEPQLDRRSMQETAPQI